MSSFITVYGRFFDSIEDAAEHMKEYGVITTDEKADFLLDKWIDGIQFFDKKNGTGILGFECDDDSNNIVFGTMKEDIEKLDALIGHCEMHIITQK